MRRKLTQGKIRTLHKLACVSGESTVHRFSESEPLWLETSSAQTGVLRLTTSTYPDASTTSGLVQRHSREAWEDHPHFCPHLHWEKKTSHHNSPQHKGLFWTWSGLAAFSSTSLLSIFQTGTTVRLGETISLSMPATLMRNSSWDELKPCTTLSFSSVLLTFISES